LNFALSDLYNMGLYLNSDLYQGKGRISTWRIFSE